MRIFLDANILFSASLPKSRIALLLDLLFDRATCLTNQYALEQVPRNLEHKSPASLPRLQILAAKCEMITTLVIEISVPLKSKDIPILGGAIAGQATHLLTGDERDFGPLFGKTIQGVTIFSPRMLAEKLVILGWIERG